MSKQKVRIVVEPGKQRGTRNVTLYDPNSGRTAPGGQVTERDIQRRVEEISHQARQGGNDVDTLER